MEVQKMAFGFNEDKSRVEVPTKADYDLTKLAISVNNVHSLCAAGKIISVPIDVPVSDSKVIPVMKYITIMDSGYDPNRKTYSGLVQIYVDEYTRTPSQGGGVDPLKRLITICNGTSNKIEVNITVYIIYKPVIWIA